MTTAAAETVAAVEAAVAGAVTDAASIEAARAALQRVFEVGLDSELPPTLARRPSPMTRLH